MMEDRMTNGNANWLVMVYISADGVLANFAVESLKQLKRAAGKDVVVVAQFETDGIIPAKLYVFDGTDATKPLTDGEPVPVKRPASVERPSAGDLKDFINRAVGKAPQAEHHALFLWGHGPELLSNEGPRSEAEAADERKNPDKSIETNYLRPSDLKEALSRTQLANQNEKIDILGLDACSMSMAELATELGEHVQFMVASQDDVPDQSFPYGDILPRLKDLASAKDASTVIPEVYREAYRDYITDPRTGFRGFTLSTVDLDKNKIGRVTAALTKLAALLLELSKNKDARGKIFDARKVTRGFVFGLFVDIVDLCDKLKASKIASPYLSPACDEMRKAIKGAVAENSMRKNPVGPVQPVDKQTPAGARVEAVHGLSVYFPYRIPDLTEQLQELRKGAGGFPKKERTQRIHELERDFAGLQRFSETGWMKFIQEGWSSILTEQAAEEAKKGRLILDEIYSAQQCAQNLGSLGPDQEQRREYEAKQRATARPIPREEPAA